MPKKFNRKSNWKPKYFPRLKTPVNFLRVGIEVLHKEWNRIARDKKQYHIPDVFEIRSKNLGEKAQHYFPIIVDMLFQNGIPIKTFIQVISKQGIYSRFNMMPDPKTLADEKILETYGWMYRKEKAKFPSEFDWKQHLKTADSDKSILRQQLKGKGDSDRRILNEVVRSAKYLRKYMKVFEVDDVATAAALESNYLSPWFLVACGSYLRDYPLDILSPADAKVLGEAMRHYLRNEKTFKKVRDKIREEGFH